MGISNSILSQPLNQLDSELTRANQIVGKFKSGEVQQKDLEAEVGKINKNLDFVGKVFSKIQDASIGQAESARQMEELRTKIETTQSSLNNAIEDKAWDTMNPVERFAKKVWKGVCGLFGKKYTATNPKNNPAIDTTILQALILSVKEAKPPQSIERSAIYSAGEQLLAIAAPVTAKSDQLDKEIHKMGGELTQAFTSFASGKISKTDKELNEMNANLSNSPLKGKTWVAAHGASPAVNGASRIEIERFSQKGIADSAASGAKLGGNVMGLAGKDAGMVKKGLAGLGGFVVGLAAAGVGAVHDAARLAGVASNWNRTKEYVSVENSNGQARIIVRDEGNNIKGNFASVNQFKQHYLNPDKVASFKEADAAAAKAAPKPQPAPAAAKPAAAQAAPVAAKESAQLEKLNAFIKAHPEAVLRADHPAIKYIHDAIDSQEQGKAPLPAELRNRYALVQEAGEWKIFGVDRNGERWYGDALDPESGNEFDLQAILKEEQTDIPDGQLKASVLNNEWIETVQVLVQSAPAQAKPQPAPSREAQQALAAEAAAKVAPKAQPPLASPARPSALKMAAEAAALQKEAARPVSPTVSRAAQEQLARAAAAEAAARAAAAKAPSGDDQLRAFISKHPGVQLGEEHAAVRFIETMVNAEKAAEVPQALRNHYALVCDREGDWYIYGANKEGQLGFTPLDLANETLEGVLRREEYNLETLKPLDHAWVQAIEKAQVPAPSFEKLPQLNQQYEKDRIKNLSKWIQKNPAYAFTKIEAKELLRRLYPAAPNQDYAQAIQATGEKNVKQLGIDAGEAKMAKSDLKIFLGALLKKAQE